MYNQNELRQQVTAFFDQSDYHSFLWAASVFTKLCLTSASVLVFKLMYIPIAWTAFLSLFSLSKIVTLPVISESCGAYHMICNWTLSYMLSWMVYPLTSLPWVTRSGGWRKCHLFCYTCHSWTGPCMGLGRHLGNTEGNSTESPHYWLSAN